jgi:hypothetical protein
MQTYESLFIMHAANLLHIKMLPGLILAIGDSGRPSCLKCQLICIHTGAMLLVRKVWPFAMLSSDFMLPPKGCHADGAQPECKSLNVLQLAPDPYFAYQCQSQCCLRSHLN